MKLQKGFTLIELVIVVVILGFLAVTAIPKFLDLTDQAKQANIEGMAGGYATAVSLVRAQWEAEGRPENGSGQNSVNYDGVDLVLTTEATDVRPGYVTGLTDGASLGGGFDVNNCVEIWQNILQQPPVIESTITNLNNNGASDYLATSIAGAGNAGNAVCAYYLKESLAKDSSGDFVAPTSAAATSTGNLFTYDPSNSSVVVYINN
ncbi:MAG: MSHA biogenesis protein MshB [Colwelliaceae bacterium]|nr:MSHA biogenesis protein MshB [Colwelliaceae bacterium]|tara:strand:- start:543 stop:1160 length:618 start_codon:yes stop_codon:yes gene_type:complete